MSNKLWDKKQLAFRDAIKDIRNRQGLKQEQLAKKLKKPQSYISKYENGERKLDFIEVLDICSACNVSVEDFVVLYQSKL